MAWQQECSPVSINLHPDERTRYEEQLRRRAQQLARLVRAGYFEQSTLALFVGQVLRAAVPLCGEGLRSELLEWLARKGREDLGLCAFCGSRKGADALVCITCSNEMETLDLQLRLETADEAVKQ
jgi:hypothetical protein